MSHPKLTLVLPAHNEAGIIGESVRRVDAFLDSLGITYRVLVGDSASTDGTADVVTALGLANVHVIRSSVSGKGAILTRCLQASRGDFKGFIDADLEIDVDYVGPMLESLDSGFDAVIASKALDNTLNRDRPFTRRMNTTLYNGLARFMFRTPFSDHQAGLKLFRSAAIDAVLPRVEATAWLWDTEVLVGLVRDGRRVREYPIETTPRQDSRFVRTGSSLGLLRELAGLWVRVRRS